VIRASRVTWNEHGDPRVTITLEGSFDVYRFAHNMTGQQCEFADQGWKILRALRRRWGRDRFRHAQVQLHGKVVHP
jgi:hypothetical protein